MGRDDTISIYSTSGGHLLVDVLGTIRRVGDTVSSGRLVGLASADRVLDTRTNGVPVGSGERISFGIPSGVDATLVSALVVP